ncbi:2-dehydro-3-deoxyphosphooctonate aldolase [Chryseobacterium sp. GCR10]|uniref:2-dehydro-3-deoxyphosphooctonate aldolase n=1 Tax=Chryseobacterium caseinilyticum TaxID=2771428 RepID=A0ABR8ZBY9_9FLAO|nr:2-dehydro-3-deoxyphosphooctonate aldolase [Chryseobacterium caseinilyticum]
MSSDETYGYTEKNPVKVGGATNGPSNERKYLNSLTGPNGEAVSFVRNGSCCAFSTKNSPFGGGLLDMYSVTYEGKKDTVTLYLNMYDKGKLKAPAGFKIK